MLDQIKSALARITWPQVGLLAVVLAAALYAAHTLPDDRWDTLVSIVVAVLASMGLAVGPRMLRRGGPSDGAVLVLLAALTSGGLVSGCGASPMRQHASASHAVMATLAGADLAIRHATRIALERCPAADGAEREACIGSVELHATTAAAARDVLIMPAHTYRDAVLATGGDEDADAIAYLGALALAVVYDWPSLAGAMRALGVPVPDLPALLGALAGGGR